MGNPCSFKGDCPGAFETRPALPAPGTIILFDSARDSRRMRDTGPGQGVWSVRAAVTAADAAVLSPRTRKTEADVVVPVLRRVVVPVRAAHVPRVVVPTAAAEHAIRAAFFRLRFPHVSFYPYYPFLEVNASLRRFKTFARLTGRNLRCRAKVAQMSDKTGQTLL